MSVYMETKNVDIVDGTDTYHIVFCLKYETYLYGADADGNRGERRTELVDSEVIDVSKNGQILLIEDIPDHVVIRAEEEVGE